MSNPYIDDEAEHSESGEEEEEGAYASDSGFSDDYDIVDDDEVDDEIGDHAQLLHQQMCESDNDSVQEYFNDEDPVDQ
jgi:hypothetical protein